MTLSVMYDNSSLEIEGNADALRKLSLKISGCDGTCQVTLPDFSEVNERGLGYANGLTISVGSGPVSIARLEKHILISGSKEKLQVLAQNFLWLADREKPETLTKIRDHLHIDYYPGHFFLEEGALPLTISRQDDLAPRIRIR